MSQSTKITLEIGWIRCIKGSFFILSVCVCEKLGPHRHRSDGFIEAVNELLLYLLGVVSGLATLSRLTCPWTGRPLIFPPTPGPMGGFLLVSE